MSLGMPTLVRLSAEEDEALTGFAGGVPPPFDRVSNLEEIVACLERYAVDRTYLAQRALECRAWMEKYCHEKRLLDWWMDIIEQTPVWECNSEAPVLTRPLELDWGKFYRMVWSLPVDRWWVRVVYYGLLAAQGTRWRLRRLFRDKAER